MDLVRHEVDISGGTAHWHPKTVETYNGKIFCDDGRSSACQSIQVLEKETTTTHEPHPTYWPTFPPVRTTITATIKTTTTKKSTTTKTTTTINITTKITTTTTEVTIEEETTTTFDICNRNYECEVSYGENYGNCPSDCPSGFPDDYCDKMSDNRCDPDCLNWEDPDCEKTKCGDGLCEKEEGETLESCSFDCNTTICGDNYCDYDKGENYPSCKEDCSSGSKDGYCDGVKDGKCDPDCKKNEDLDCKWYLFPALIFLLFILLLSILFFLYRHGKKLGYADKNVGIISWIKKKLKEGEDPEVLKKGLEAEGYDPKLVDKAEENLWES